MNDEQNDTPFEHMMQLVNEEGIAAMPKAMTILYNAAMKAERDAHLCAGRYERSEARDGYANGFKPKRYQTRMGELELQIPQVRGSSERFYPKTLDRGSRSERAIALAAAEMYFQGVSTRRVETVFRQLDIEHVSAEQVSKAAKLMDEQFGSWRKRKLGCFKVIFADATYQKVRIDGVVHDMATFIVTGISDDGHRSILAVDSAFDEAEIHWRKVLEGLVERGLHGVKLIVSDDHVGLRAARKAVFPGVPWQRCQMHLQRNAQNHLTKTSLKEEVALDIRNIFNAPSLEEAKRLLDLFVKKYEKTQSCLAKWAEENLPEGFTVFSLPVAMRKKLRTNNLDERLNRSIKARTQLISVFPNQASQLRLVTAICVEISDDWETGNIYLNVDEL